MVCGDCPAIGTPQVIRRLTYVKVLVGLTTIRGTVVHSSQPMEGGLLHASPSMSIPVATETPTARAGDVSITCTPSPISCGASERFPTPAASGRLTQYASVEPV